MVNPKPKKIRQATPRQLFRVEYRLVIFCAAQDEAEARGEAPRFIVREIEEHDDPEAVSVRLITSREDIDPEWRDAIPWGWGEHDEEIEVSTSDFLKGKR